MRRARADSRQATACDAITRPEPTLRAASRPTTSKRERTTPTFSLSLSLLFPFSLTPHLSLPSDGGITPSTYSCRLLSAAVLPSSRRRHAMATPPPRPATIPLPQCVPDCKAHPMRVYSACNASVSIREIDGLKKKREKKG